MKKTLIFASLLGLAFVSCRKERTCECTFTPISQTSTQPNYSIVLGSPSTTSTKYEKVNRRSDAVKNCKSYERTQVSSYVVGSGTNAATYEMTRVDKTECEIK